jgi:hypothetical protein
MDRFFNALKAQSGAQDAGLGQPRFAIVTSVDPTRPAARVTIQPEGVLSGWLPVLSPCVGAGWGLSCPPSPGDQVLILAQEGNAEHGVVIGRAWSDQAQTPPAPSGEIWLVHQSGSYLKLTSDGAIHANGDLHLTGNIFATGNISDGVGSLARLRSHYDAHVHGTSPATSQPD